MEADERAGGNRGGRARGRAGEAYLARIIGVTLPWQPALARRDEEIAKLRAKL